MGDTLKFIFEYNEYIKNIENSNNDEYIYNEILKRTKFNRLVIFDAGQLHAVTPVTKGTRKAIAINLWDSPLTDADNMLR